MDIDTLINEKIEADVDFQDSISFIEDEAERNTLLENKRKEVLTQEFASLKEKAEKEEELARNYKIRAEKAESLKKEKVIDDKTTTKTDDLSSRDLYALMNAKVEQDDVEEVIKASKLLGKTVQEALKDETVQAILKTRGEYRKTAGAMNTKQARSGVKTVTDSEILAKASRGEMPDKGSEEAERLFWARRGRGK